MIVFNAAEDRFHIMAPALAMSYAFIRSKALEGLFSILFQRWLTSTIPAFATRHAAAKGQEPQDDGACY